MYEKQWFVGLILDVSIENQDVLIKFMCPSGPRLSLKWPRHDDICWVPIHHILCTIETPITSIGRTYAITSADYSKFVDLYKNARL